VQKILLEYQTGLMRTYADAATATIQVVGNVDDAQTGLTAGVKYYVEKDGSLGTDSNQPYAGLGVSSTEILIKG
jgi:hypothetical protein